MPYRLRAAEDGPSPAGDGAGPPSPSGGRSDPPGPPPWGVWESAATAALFCVPAAMVLRAGWETPATGDLGAAGWAIVGGGIGASLALTLAARGLVAARVFLSTGLLASFAWAFSDWLVHGSGPIGRAYGPLVFAMLAGHYNLAPFALFSAARKARGSVPDGAMGGIRRRIWGAACSAVALDLTPAVYAVTPRAARTPVVIGWVAACMLAGGGLAASAMAGIVGHASRTGGGQG